MDNNTRDDLQGRIESFDQSVRSLTGRLRAVERRLSIEVPEDMVVPCEIEDNGIDGIKTELSGLADDMVVLRTDVDSLRSFVEGDLMTRIEVLDDRMSGFECRAEVREKPNEVTIGSLKIPLEISGIVGSLIFFLAGYLIYLQRWDIMRSPLFYFAIAFLLGISVIGRFYVLNRE